MTDYVRRTGSRCKGFQWVAARTLPGKTEIVVPMDPTQRAYACEARIEAYGSTRLRAIEAFRLKTGETLAV